VRSSDTNTKEFKLIADIIKNSFDNLQNGRIFNFEEDDEELIK